MNPPLKTHGGKHYLAPQLWELAIPVMPKVITSVETHCGGCAWTLEGLARRFPIGFVVNDIDAELMNFWFVLQNPESFETFKQQIEATPFSEWEFRQASTQNVLTAASFFVRCRQSLAGRGKSFAAITKTRTRRGMQEQVSAWLTAVDGLPEVHALLRQVLCLNRDAIACINTMDSPGTLFYIDPPYMPTVRTVSAVYAHEMTVAQHVALLKRLRSIKGKFLLSGYRSPLYDACARAWGWTRHDFDIPNNAAAGETKRRMIECVWRNYA